MSDMNNTPDGIHTSGSLGEKAEIFHSGKGNVSGCPSPALIPVRAPLPTPNAQKIRTPLCKGNRYDSFVFARATNDTSLLMRVQINPVALKLNVVFPTLKFTM